MTETLVPLGRGGLDAERRLAVGGGRRATKQDGVESAMTSTVKKDFLRGRVLNKEKRNGEIPQKHHYQGRDDKQREDVDEYVEDEEYFVNEEMNRV